MGMTLAVKRWIDSLSEDRYRHVLDVTRQASRLLGLSLRVTVGEEAGGARSRPTTVRKPSSASERW
jgi:hypothetical protein